jgi:hypothetical protein
MGWGRFHNLQSGCWTRCVPSFMTRVPVQRSPLFYVPGSLTEQCTDWRWLHEHQLRYDLTVIPPATFAENG